MLELTWGPCGFPVCASSHHGLELPSSLPLRKQLNPTDPTYPKMSTKIEKTLQRQREKYRSTSLLCILLFAYTRLTPPKDRRRSILRSPPTTPRRRVPLYQSPRLGKRNFNSIPRRPIPPASWTRRLRRRPLHIPPRRIQQGRSQARCLE